jgi:hypothetical protein
MNNFLLIFRQDSTKMKVQPSPQQMQDMMKEWQHWMGGIAARKKLVDAGNRLAGEGKVVKSNELVTDGPYVELKEAVGGYIVVGADSLDEAAEISKGCPIFTVGGNVEVRQIIPM